MLFVSVFKELYAFLKKLHEKSFRLVVSAIMTCTIVLVVSQNNKINAISATLKKADSTEKVNDEQLNQKIRWYIDQLYVEGSIIFREYTTQQTEDLKTIIDNTTVTAANSALLKKLIEKSTNDINQEIRKAQFRNKILKPDSLGGIGVRPNISCVDSILKMPFYARSN